MDHSQLNVLVIDDDPASVQLLSAIIARGEHQIVTATTAEEGLELLPFWTFQVAFIDHKLPGMDGLVLGEYLRRHNPDMTVALVTGDDDAKLQTRSKAEQIVFLPKPFDVSDVLAVLDAYVVGAEERRKRRLDRADENFHPDYSAYVGEIAASYAMAKVPERVKERLVETIKRGLNDLRSVGRYNERDRVIVLGGLIAAKVLGVELPKVGEERTLYQEYDALMGEHGRATAFGGG
jgi:DNA-binding NtrC family response regulator